MNINPFDILKNAQKIQEQVGSIQDSLGSISAVGTAGGGMVEITISGKMEVLSVRIKPEVVDPGDITVLEDLISAALGQALEKIREKITAEIGSLAGGIGIPIPGFGGS
ncbi:MAG: YbaB/EbfC family nucleoid-associated protein [Treponema sp.]|jgi:DNA-binding YbaB/EbfC family protein|nr:YbaB/EbfC family nucleoid-associated protein [Treponema sp.]